MKYALHKTLFLLTLLFSMSNTHSQPPQKDYAPNWKKVEDFIKKNLPASALQEVKSIYTLAKKEKQEAQVVKSLLYMTTLQSETREENEALSIRDIEKEISGSTGATRALLQSMLAGIYQGYFQRQRWQIYSRTNTINFVKEDIATWTADDFHRQITSLYLASLEDEKALQKILLKPYDAIILKGNMRHLRPTLFDMLAHEALAYFGSTERDLSRPAYAFEIDQAAAFDPAADFIHRSFTTKDTASLHHKALLLWQRLIAFHISDEKPDALIDADLGRLQFVKTYATHPDKEELYFLSVNHIAHQYESTPAAAQAWYLVAAHYHQQGQTYQAYGDSTHRMALVKAKEICEKLLLQKDSSEGKINAYNLLQTLKRPSLRFSLEKVNVPQQPFRALVKYKNFQTLYLRIIPADERLLESLNQSDNQAYWKKLIAIKSIKTWEQPLPPVNDLQEHSTEIKIDALPAGSYMLIAGTDKNFSDKKTILGARTFYISSISFVSNETDFFVLDRQSGQPLAGAAVQVWEQQYDYKQSKYIREKKDLYHTDKNGYFRKKESAAAGSNRYNRPNYLLEINYKADKLRMGEWINDYYYHYDENAEKVTNNIFLFTDRSLYRPGQTVYFKGIVLSKTQKGQAGILAAHTTTIYLRDANYQDIDSLRLTTNEYGSFSGTFRLPASGLNGNFSLYSKKENAAASFYVEEYKRPKFYAEYEPVKETYRVNDSITVTGFAKAYAGNNIDGATVKYRVVRQPRFIYHWLFRRGWLPPVQEMEIAHGEITTGTDGRFTVTFSAIPDRSIHKKLDPVFDYTIYADVTDINGETRSAATTVSAGYKSLLIKSALPASLPADSLKQIPLLTQNMNGEFVPTPVTVTITRLKTESRLIRERYWERPDQFIMTKEEYTRLFPHDEYDNETDPASREKEEVVFTKTDSSRKDGLWPAGISQLAPGSYMIEISTADEKNETVKEIKYVELHDPRQHKLSLPSYLLAEQGRPIEPGEKTTIQIGSAATDIFLIQQTEKGYGKEQQVSYSFQQLNNEKKSFIFTATEADRGGYGVSWMFVRHNRVYQYQQTIVVPWSNKDLKIEYATFRDKALPGSEEKWKLKISGAKNEKLAAEMLAGMYDASLDQFYHHQWHLPGIWPSYYSYRSWSSLQNFSKADMSRNRDDNDYKTKFLNKDYDRFVFSYQDIYYYGGQTFNIRREMRASGGKEEEMKDMMMAAPALEVSQDGLSLFEKAKDIVNQSLNEPVLMKGQAQANTTQIRKNFNETAFFFPELRTDEAGNIEFSFTLPEALTRWKFQAIAHTKELALGYSSKEIITQKELMVQPNPTRFLRQGDTISFSAKIANLSEKELSGTAQLQLFNAATNQPVDGLFSLVQTTQPFRIATGQSAAVQFPLVIPTGYQEALVWRITAKAGDHSDGEENMLPVLTNRMLVTETLPLHVKGNTEKTFRFDKLINSGQSNTLQHHSLTIEYTSNPVWYAVQALPYLMEYPYECAEQTWNRYYANSLAAFIANSSPRIKQVFEQWKTTDTAALMSKLQQNQELKSLLLEETPWLLQGKSEAEQKRNIALLFDMVKMSSQLSASLEKLKQLQSPNGGFVWFAGGPDDRYITQYIITGIGHLQKLNGVAAGQQEPLQQVLSKAIPYLDKKIKEDYDALVKNKTDLTKYTPGHTVVQYLYMRSFFPAYKIPAASQKAYDYFMKRLPLSWTKQNKYMQGMIALALYRSSDAKTPAAILKSLKETSINNEELGRYWKDAGRSWWWYEAPVERQALLIEAFLEAGNDKAAADELRTWLLKNKQTTRWESTKATAEACYALLLQGTDWLVNDPAVTITAGTTVVRSADIKQEAGTGYFKTTFTDAAVKPEMGNMQVKVSGNAPSASSWGGVYWQYFEDLDKITTAATPLQLTKKLFVEKNTDTGPVLSPVADRQLIKTGDKIKVRIELRADRDMEYVHMKDMRAAALEPVNVLSGYRWQDGLGYYESTKDASTNFFFSYLRKGTYVFEYTLFATHAGNFSNGITTIQCMYAPEFTSHSEGIRIQVQ